MEKLSLKKVAKVAVPLGLLLAACGTDDPVVDKPSINETVSNDITAKYFEDGTRLLVLPENFYDVLQFCDGMDLVDVSSSTYVEAGSSVARTINHPACADGRLTPSDFTLSYNG